MVFTISFSDEKDYLNAAGQISLMDIPHPVGPYIIRKNDDLPIDVFSCMVNMGGAWGVQNVSYINLTSIMAA